MALHRRQVALGSLVALITVASLEVTAYLLSTTLPRPKRNDIGTLPMIEPDPITIWRFKPSTPFVYEIEGRRIRSSTNSVGVHDSEWTPLRLGKENRALAFGDSFSFGWGVELAQVWWKQLAEISAREGEPLEVFGAGYWFSTYDQHYLFFKQFFPIVRPKLVIYALFPPHVLTELTRVHHFDGAGDLVSVTDPIIAVHEGRLTYSVDGANAFSPVEFPFLISYPRRLLEQSEFEKRYRRIINLRLRDKVEYDDPLLKSRAEIMEPGFEKLFVSLRLMDSYSRAHGAEFIAVLIPAVGQVLAGRLEPVVSAYAREVLSSGYPQDKIVAFCREHGIVCLDPLAEFRADPGKEKLYLPTDVHFSPAGHAALAGVVRRYLSTTKAPKRPSAAP